MFKKYGKTIFEKPFIIIFTNIESKYYIYHNNMFKYDLRCSFIKYHRYKTLSKKRVKLHIINELINICKL